LTKKISAYKSISSIENIPESIRAVFLTSSDISYSDHIKMQTTFQKHCDSSVSKTINFPESATREDVKSAYELAYKLGCKGVTIYRDNSRPNQVLSAGTKSRPGMVQQVEKRPQLLPGFTEKIKTGYGNLYVTVTIKDGKPFEVFAHIGKSGYTTMADTEAICRLISLALRSQVPVEQVIRQLRGIGGSNQVFSEGARIFSIPDAIAQILHRHFGTPDDQSSQQVTSEICPECNGAMNFHSGCYACQSCGYSTC
jgi:ribonucleoside-diphosphate reductase alpha chain